MSSMTYKEYIKGQNPAFCEGYPCPVGTRIVAIHSETKEIKVTTFNPEELTMDWGIIYRETDDATRNKELVLYNLLVALGYRPSCKFKFSDERLNKLIYNMEGDKQ